MCVLDCLAQPMGRMIPVQFGPTLSRSVAAASLLSLFTFSAAVPVLAQEDLDPPRVDRVRFSNLPGSDDTFGSDEEIGVWVDFSEPVLVTGNPRLVLQIGDQRRSADLHRVSGNRLRFRYYVRASDRDNDGIGIPANAILLNRGAIRDWVWLFFVERFFAYS